MERLWSCKGRKEAAGIWMEWLRELQKSKIIPTNMRDWLQQLATVHSNVLKCIWTHHPFLTQQSHPFPTSYRFTNFTPPGLATCFFRRTAIQVAYEIWIHSDHWASLLSGVSCSFNKWAIVKFMGPRVILKLLWLWNFIPNLKPCHHDKAY